MASARQATVGSGHRQPKALPRPSPVTGGVVLRRTPISKDDIVRDGRRLRAAERQEQAARRHTVLGVRVPVYSMLPAEHPPLARWHSRQQASAQQQGGMHAISPEEAWHSGDARAIGAADSEMQRAVNRANRQRPSLPIVRSPNKSRERPLGMLYLQLGEEVRQIVMPNTVTSLDTVRALFVRAFPQQLSMDIMSRPDVAICTWDPKRNNYHPLEDIVVDVRDQALLKLYLTMPLESSMSHMQPRPVNGDYRDDGSWHAQGSQPQHWRHSGYGAHPVSPSGYSTGRERGVPSAAPKRIPVSPGSILDRRDVHPDENLVNLRNEGLRADPSAYYGETPSGRFSVASSMSFASEASFAGHQTPGQVFTYPDHGDDGLLEGRGKEREPATVWRQPWDERSQSAQSSSTLASDKETQERMRTLERQVAILTEMLQQKSLTADVVDAGRSATKPGRPQSLNLNRVSHATQTTAAATVLKSTGMTAGERQRLRATARQLQENAAHLRGILAELKQTQMAFRVAWRSESTSVGQAALDRLARLLVHRGMPAQKQRLQAEDERQRYINREQLVIYQLSELERDVIELQEQARITARDHPLLLDAIEEKAALLRKAGEGLAELHADFPELQSRLQSVIRMELEAMRFINDEPRHLEALLTRCTMLTDSLNRLQRMASKSPTVLPNAQPKQAAMLKIPATPPGHSPRSSPQPPTLAVLPVQAVMVDKQAHASPMEPMTQRDVTKSSALEQEQPVSGSMESHVGFLTAVGRAPCLPNGQDRHMQHTLELSNRLVTLEELEDELEARRRSHNRFTEQDFDRAVQEAADTMSYLSPDGRTRPVHSPRAERSASPKFSENRHEELVKESPEDPTSKKSEPSPVILEGQTTTMETDGHEGTDGAPDPPQRSSAFSFGLTTGRSGEVILTSRKDSQRPPSSPQPKNEPESPSIPQEQRPASPPTVSASAIESEDDEEEENRILAELQVFQLSTNVARNSDVVIADRSETPVADTLPDNTDGTISWKEFEHGEDTLAAMEVQENEELPAMAISAPETCYLPSPISENQESGIKVTFVKLPSISQPANDDERTIRVLGCAKRGDEGIVAEDHNASRLYPPQAQRALEESREGGEVGKMASLEHSPSEGSNVGESERGASVATAAIPESNGTRARQNVTTYEEHSTVKCGAVPRTITIRYIEEIVADGNEDDEEAGRGEHKEKLAFLIRESQVCAVSHAEAAQIARGDEVTSIKITSQEQDEANESTGGMSDITEEYDEGSYNFEDYGDASAVTHRDKRPLIVIFDDPMDIRSAYKRLSTIFEEKDLEDEWERYDREIQPEQSGAVTSTDGPDGFGDVTAGLVTGVEQECRVEKEKSRFRIPFPRKQLSALTSALRLGTRLGKKTLEVVQDGEETEKSSDLLETGNHCGEIPRAAAIREKTYQSLDSLEESIRDLETTINEMAVNKSPSAETKKETTPPDSKKPKPPIGPKPILSPEPKQVEPGSSFASRKDNSDAQLPSYTRLKSPLMQLRERARSTQSDNGQTGESVPSESSSTSPEPSDAPLQGHKAIKIFHSFRHNTRGPGQPGGQQKK
uniref:sickle tail protein homolog isoform X2 n=1 Tax=Myxine glutinosa TaxID=7769 RepID=UPI00358EF6F4